MNLLVFASPQIQRGGSTDAFHCGTLKIIHKKASKLKRRALGCLREKCGAGEDEFVHLLGVDAHANDVEFPYSKTRHGLHWFATN
jgi:hypothetical protein